MAIGFSELIPGYVSQDVYLCVCFGEKGGLVSETQG